MAKGNGKQMNFDEYVKMMEEWFSKLPPLPTNVKDILVKLAPWFALIFGIIGILGSIAATGFLTVLSPFIALGGGLGVATGGIVAGVLGLVGSVLTLMAYPGLRDRKMMGWKYSFYSQLTSVVAALVGLNLVGAVVSALIGFYILFQIKSYYK